MRITYITHTRFPTEKAHGNQVAQVCAALAALGHEVTLVAPTVHNNITEDAYRYYGVPRSFRIIYPGSFDALSSRAVPGPLSFLVSMWSYGRTLQSFLRQNSADLLYVRSPSLLRRLLATGIPVMLELHTVPGFLKRHFARLCNRCFRVICLTTPMRDAMVQLGVDPVRISVEGDAVELERFMHMPSAAEAKVLWELPADVPVVGYAGSLVTRNTLEKGVRELLEALSILQKEGVKVFGFIVGGPSSWRSVYEERARQLGLDASAVKFLDRVPPLKIPTVLAAFDVCVYPAPRSSDPFFHRDTSPLKLFEYLASGRPTVCANLAPVRDIVDEKTVRLCSPGDPRELANAIRWVILHPEQAAERAKKGRELVNNHTWVERMRRIIGG